MVRGGVHWSESDGSVETLQLEAGSYLGAAGPALYRLSGAGVEEATLYVRSRGTVERQ